VRWLKNGSFGFLSVGSCVGKKQMAHLWLGFFTLKHITHIHAKRNSFPQNYKILSIHANMNKGNVSMPE